MKRVTLSLLALAMSGAAAFADEIKVPYQERPLSDSTVSRIWKDMIPDASGLGDYAPWAYVAIVPIGEGRSLTISQLWAGNQCSAKDCPVRVYEGEEILLDDMLCSIIDGHSISDDGRILTACEVVARINRR